MDKQKKIVIVDDVNFQLMLMKDRLKNDYEVYPAQSAEILYEVLEKITPDLILLDINMPDMDGYKIIEALKADNRFDRIPVVFLTSQNDRESVIKGMGLGAADFLAKPVSNSKLLECIERQLSPEKQIADKPIILAIDDSPAILQSINHTLGKQFTVYTLPKPEMLETVLNKLMPDLFLLDYQMPKLTGFELVPIIRKYPEHEDTPIIFLTSECSHDHVTVAINLGASDFIVKPIDETLIFQKVASHSANYLMRRRMREIFSATKKAR